MKTNTCEIHQELLDKNRRQCFKNFKHLSNDFILGGGTGISLQIAHRLSFDFDLFYSNPLSKKLLPKIRQIFAIKEILKDTSDELSLIIKPDIQLTCLYYPFKPVYEPVKTPMIKLFNLKDLAADKAYTIGRRAEYKDYIDLFFLIKQKRTQLKQIIKDAQRKFKNSFNAKLFLEQLTYFDDLNDFEIEFVQKQYTQDEVKTFLIKTVNQYLAKENLG